MNECGLKPRSLAAKLKCSARISVNKKNNVVAELAKDDVTTVKQFLPQVKGCTIQIVKVKSQFTVYYPNAVPGSRSRTFGAVFSKAQVCRAVIEWSWSQHTRATGQACPHNLGLISLK